jgi:2-keto-4-pentenoate hydratase/2-oxohepta-3-ene-1,7-dioic acid hydratase in catechol pathway
VKLVRFTTQGKTRLGKIVGDDVVDLPAACPAISNDMIELLQGGVSLLALAEKAPKAPGATYELSKVRLEAPVPNPSKYLAIGLNYGSHVAEASRIGVQSTQAQVWFNKQVSCIAGPYDPIHMPRVSEKLDWEVELCVVVGKRCRHVPVERASGVIAGYMVANDVSVRDWQMMTPTWTLGKSFDTHGPIGPWLVTADEIPDPHDLLLRLTVNGEERQRSSTRNMIHDIHHQIAHLTKVMTLMPGDLIATGTPEGVGVAMRPPVFLKVGDVVRAEAERIGYIESRVIEEPI